MNEKELQLILQEGEGYTIEFKENVNSDLAKGLTIKDFGNISVPRNLLITSLFLRANYIERMGTGISRIRTALEEQEHKEPVFEFDSFFHVIFPRRIEESSPLTSPKTRIETRAETRIEILSEISKNPKITSLELAKIIGITKKGVDWQIKKLREFGEIKHIGPNKGGYWEIIDSKINNNISKTMEKSSVKTRIESSPIGSEKSSERILKYIKENSEITIEELSELLDVSMKTIERHISELKELGKIHYIKPSKNGYWEIIEDKE